MTRVIKRLYDWMLTWAHSRYGIWALAVLACVESSVFPIPPDVLLMALCLSQPQWAWRYAAVTSLSSVIGGVIGYGIGFYAFEWLGKPVLEWYGVMDKYVWLSDIYQKYDAFAVFVAGFTPIPYKVFTIAAGACQLNLVVFIAASLVGRALRFYVIAFLLNRYGVQMKGWIEKYFAWLTYGFVALLALGFLVLKWIL